MYSLYLCFYLLSIYLSVYYLFTYHYLCFFYFCIIYIHYLRIAPHYLYVCLCIYIYTHMHIGFLHTQKISVYVFMYVYIYIYIPIILVKMNVFQKHPSIWHEGPFSQPFHHSGPSGITFGLKHEFKKTEDNAKGFSFKLKKHSTLFISN